MPAPTRPQEWRRGWSRAATLIVLIALVALGAGPLAHAQPTDSPPPPSSQAARPPVPLPPAEGCAPGSPLPACHLPAPPPADGSDPCSGPGCLPQPQAPSPGAPTAPGSSPPGPGVPESSCGLMDPMGCVTGFFRTLVTSALNPLLDLLGRTLLTTPTPEQLPRLGQLWSNSWRIMLAGYGLLVLAGGVLVMTYQTAQTQYSIKEIAPRVVLGFVAGALSLFVAGKAITVANALSRAVAGMGVKPDAAATALREMLFSALGSNAFTLFLGLFVVGTLVALLVTYIVRVTLTIILVAGAPLALMGHALPQTDGIARFWWKAFFGCLAVQVAQSLTLITAMRVFLTPGGFTVLGPNRSGVVNLLVSLALLYVLVKIPFWILSAARGGGGGRSVLGGLVKTYLMGKTLGLLRGAGAAKTASRPRTRRSSPSPGTERGESDPPATRSGQFLLPVSVRRSPQAPRATRRLDDEPSSPGVAESRGAGRGQFSLFTRAGKPNPRARPPRVARPLPRDQHMLPIAATREPHRQDTPRIGDEAGPGAPPVPDPGPNQQALVNKTGRVSPAAKPPTVAQPVVEPETGMLPIRTPRAAHPAPPRHTLADEPTGQRRVEASRGDPALFTRTGTPTRAARPPRPARPADPYAGNRPTRSGQYPLPLGTRRRSQPKPAPSKPADPPQQPPPTRPAPRGRQQPLPLDLPTKKRRQGGGSS